MPKEKSINPAQAQRKAEKAKAVKKGKAEAATRRTEKLARRNPERLQTQLSSLLAIESSGTKLTAHEVRLKDELEKDLKAVRKAREVLGDKAPGFGRGGGDRGGRDGGRDRDGGRGGGVLGKRRRDGGRGGEESESDVPEEVAGVPMPRDTPPPIPKEVLDKWYQARRDKWAANNPQQAGRGEGRGGEGSSANAMPLGANAREVGTGGREEETRRPKAPPPVEAKTVYEAAPAIRDLRKEAVSAFVPAAVRRKMEMAGGRGGLVGEGEAEELERGGYWKGAGGGGGEGDGREGKEGKDVEGKGKGGKGVTMEEVEDEDAR
ncbi:hypothetical protein VE00_09231 [Pseudogymnoascus sp. WSF 3629]|nr:hypothetical protein VE00_09231 [Pseudogymnoascus sp. WSF 3629]